MVQVLQVPSYPYCFAFASVVASFASDVVVVEESSSDHLEESNTKVKSMVRIRTKEFFSNVS